MRYRYLTLLLVAALTGLVAFRLQSSVFVSAYLANLSAGFLAAATIVLLVERQLEAARDNERTSFERLALAEAQKPTSALLHLLADAIKAASPPAAVLPETMDELLTPEMFETLAWLDLAADAPSLPRQTWRAHLSSTTGKATERLDIVLQKYSPFLSSDTARAIEDVRQDSFVGLMASMQSLASLGPEVPTVCLNETGGLRAKTANRLRALLATINEHAGTRIGLSANFLRADVVPRRGSARLASLPPAIEVARGALPKRDVRNL